jgi:hypothetical protein
MRGARALAFGSPPREVPVPRVRGREPGQPTGSRFTGLPARPKTRTRGPDPTLPPELRPEAEDELRERRGDDQHQERHDRDRRSLTHERLLQTMVFATTGSRRRLRGDGSGPGVQSTGPGGTSVTDAPLCTPNSAAAERRSRARDIKP